MNYSRGLIIKFSIAEMKEFIITDNKKLEDNDRIVLSNYTLLNLYNLIVNHNEREHTSEEDRFISTFLKYYNDTEDDNK